MTGEASGQRPNQGRGDKGHVPGDHYHRGAQLNRGVEAPQGSETGLDVGSDFEIAAPAGCVGGIGDQQRPLAQCGEK